MFKYTYYRMATLFEGNWRTPYPKLMAKALLSVLQAMLLLIILHVIDRKTLSFNLPPETLFPLGILLFITNSIRYKKDHSLIRLSETWQDESIKKRTIKGLILVLSIIATLTMTNLIFLGLF